MTGGGGGTGACRETGTPSPYQRRHTRGRGVTGACREMGTPSPYQRRHTRGRGVTGRVGRWGHRRLTNAVILREVAVSMVGCRGRWILWLMRWQAEMDSATARGMTKFGFCGYFGNDGRGRSVGGVSGDGDTVALPTSSYCAKSQYPWWGAEGAGFSGCYLGRPRWIPRLRAE